MNILTPLLAVVLGALAIAVNRYFAGPKLFEQIAVVVVVLVVVLWILSVFGLLGGLTLDMPRAG